MSKFTISRVALSDLTDLTALFDAYRQFYGYDSDIGNAKAYLKARIEEQNIHSFIARQNNHAIGFANAYSSFSSVSMRKTWILNDLYVLEINRRQGAAKALIQYVETAAKDNNAVRITLRTGFDNLAAQKCYDALGWQRNDCLFYSHDTKNETKKDTL